MRLPLATSRERPLSCVPRSTVAVLAVALALQVAWQSLRPGPGTVVSGLPPPPSLAMLRIAGLGEPVPLSRGLMLWLQSFDYQGSVSIPFKDLDYHRLTGWLGVILDLDPRSRYPLLSAARVYSEVPDHDRQRQVLDFVYRRFLRDPVHRWPWLAHAVYVAKYRLEDRELALSYARAIRKNVPAGVAPDWAMQMELFILDDMGETEAARVLLGGMLESGIIKDRQQLAFLKQRLGMKQEGLKSNQ